MKCLNCDHEFAGNFCPNCGQTAATGRLTARNLIGPVLELANMERGLWATVVGLLRSPGAVINDYLAGRRVRYVPPVKFVLIAVSSALIVMWLIGVEPTGQAETLQAEFNRVVQQWGNVLLLLTVPVSALGSRLIFRRPGLNFTEHLALNAYVFGQQNWVSLAILPFKQFGPTMATISESVYVLFCVGYYAIALRQTVARGWLTATLGAGLITLISWMAFYFVIGVVIALLRS